MTLYLENPKEKKKKLLKLAPKSSKVMENKINSPKSIIYVHVRNRHWKMKLRKNTIYNNVNKYHRLKNEFDYTHVWPLRTKLQNILKKLRL